MRKILLKIGLIPLFLLFSFAATAVSFPSPQPNTAQGEYIVDKANMIKARDAKKINQLIQQLQQDKKIPMIVVTINSLQDYQVKKDQLSAYDKMLFSHFHYETNSGVMLLLVKDGRHARIQFGVTYGTHYIKQSTAILETKLIPAWEHGNLSNGIAKTVQGIVKMLEQPSQ